MHVADKVPRFSKKRFRGIKHRQRIAYIPIDAHTIRRRCADDPGEVVGAEVLMVLDQELDPAVAEIRQERAQPFHEIRKPLCESRLTVAIPPIKSGHLDAHEFQTAAGKNRQQRANVRRLEVLQVHRHAHAIVKDAPDKVMRLFQLLRLEVPVHGEFDAAQPVLLRKIKNIVDRHHRHGGLRTPVVNEARRVAEAVNAERDFSKVHGISPGGAGFLRSMAST